MVTVEVSLTERIEEARARVKTAYDQWQAAPPVAKETARLKWEERKEELNILLNQQKYRP